MMSKLKHGQLFFVVFAILLFLSPIVAFGRIGVGVGTGKIQVDKPLKAGGIYSLPALPVLNTGDEYSEYGVSVEYHEGVSQIRPQREWFRFEPQSFSLDPGQVQLVKVTITLPAKIQPGDYFAYLEGHPIKKSVSGQTSIGVAAAAKLYFTIAPSNIIQGIYYRFISLYDRYHPWDTIILTVIFIAIASRFIGKRFKFKVARR
ncbi:MAG: hypothetical protein UV64_C0032G0003 [Parcubacteria group bacterium GW2011_GWC1_43_11b]|nr:MAG: hypothetical protein UV50_C0011G0012 [Parcubacteria group bacterium GW2011_GWB1_42_9]KKS88036.1 MAG: hypothetical protein UV64_C0032G0003 [Parcubacteria group bacterium GW2011_GWC1_43_11b]